MTALVSSSARALVAASVAPEDRVLVTGAGGWFGLTALDLLSGTGASILGLTSNGRDLEVGGASVATSTWDEELVRVFRPTHVLDFAFLTRDRVADLPLDEYVDTNRRLIARMLVAAALPDTRSIVTISSGAAVYPDDALRHPLEDNPYGFLKRETEEALTELVSDGARNAVMFRAWGVSGAYNRVPRNYALGDMILQAPGGRIDIRSAGQVWRRYSLADEQIAVALAVAGRRTAVIDSGGVLVEVGQLAEAVRAVVNPDAAISRPAVAAGPGDNYHTDDVLWSAACQEVGLETTLLEEQIAITARGLLGARRSGPAQRPPSVA